MRKSAKQRSLCELQNLLQNILCVSAVLESAYAWLVNSCDMVAIRMSSLSCCSFSRTFSRTFFLCKLRFIFLLSFKTHLKCTWTYSCLACTKKQPMCSCFVAWCTNVAKNVLFQVKNVLKNILFFLAIWDSPREVVVQLCLSCNWMWWRDIILIHL